MTFEDVVRIRTRAGFSSQRLADYLYVTVNTVRAWESPPDDPHHRKVQKWHARALAELESRVFRGDDLNEGEDL